MPLNEPLRLIVSLTIVILLATTVGARTEPEDNVIRLLHIGKAWYQYGTPAPIFVQDPRIEWYPVPAHAWSMGAEAFRMLRLYMPRSKESFHDAFDVVAICGMEALHLRLDFQDWLREGVEAKGISFIMADDSSSFGTSGTHTSWYLVPLGELLPVNDKPVGGSPYGSRESFRIVPQIPGHEFTRNIPWQEVWIVGNNRPWAKVGSTVVTKMSEEHVLNRDKVQMVYWEMGSAKGRSVAWVQAWNANPDFYRWKYSFDVIAHLMYFTAKVPVPEDLTVVHNIRTKISEYYVSRVFAISTLEFADKFGANTRQVELMMEEAANRKADADRLFLDQEYESASNVMGEVLVQLEEAMDEAVRAKDRAMLWVFVTEWFVVSATSMIAGVVVWSLMVRRRLYRDVEETRLRRRLGERSL